MHAITHTRARAHTYTHAHTRIHTHTYKKVKDSLCGQQKPMNGSQHRRVTDFRLFRLPVTPPRPRRPPALPCSLVWSVYAVRAYVLHPRFTPVSLTRSLIRFCPIHSSLSLARARALSLSLFSVDTLPSLSLFPVVPGLFSGFRSGHSGPELFQMLKKGVFAG